MGLISYAEDGGPLAEYRRLRETGRRLSQDLIRRLPQDAIHDCAKKLGLRKGKVLVFHDEDQISVLFDYCLYNYRHGGKTVMDKYLEDGSYSETSDEAAIL